MNIQNFVEENIKFLSPFEIKKGGPKLLIEEIGLPMITHMNATFGVILNQAKGWWPVWLNNDKYQADLVKSYFPESEPINEVGPSWLLKTYASLVALAKFPKILFSRNILNFYFDGVKYGDIVYDSYLYTHKIATIKTINLKLIRQMALCVFRHLKIKAILKTDNYAGVLVSHLVGIRSGVMLRVALRYGYHGYFRGGAFCDYQKLEEIYNYPFKPTPAEIDEIIEKLGPKLEPVFEQVLDNHVSDKSSMDGVDAFSKNNKFYTDRRKFNADFNLMPKRKNIFVMLHSFIDSPHSHFKWMIFKDYYDWFYQTLQFAKKNPQFNWIFKQHPSNKYYKTSDVDFKKLFAGLPKNIIYIDEEHQIDTRSLIYCADLVITCLGSAGFEIPAMGGVPSMTAADNFYTGLGFALEPKNRAEYFSLLSRANTITKLTPEARNRAKAAFIYIREYAMVSMSAFPKLSLDEQNDKKINDWYWSRVIVAYQNQREVIYNELDRYINLIKQPNFKKLTSLNELFQHK